MPLHGTEEVVVEPGAEGATEGLEGQPPVSPEGEPGDTPPAGEPGAGGDLTPPEPKYFSHDDAKNFMGEAVERLAGQMEQKVDRMLHQRFASLQPQPPQPVAPDAPLFPTTQAELDQMLQDPWAWVKMTEGAFKKNGERMEKLEGDFNKFRSGYEVQGQTQKVVQWLDDQCMAAIDGLDSFVTDKGEVDPEMYAALKALVTGYIQQNKSARGLNAKGLAKSLHDRINRVAEARYQKKIKPPPPGTPPTKPPGSGSMPVVKQPETRDAAIKGFRSSIRGLRTEG